MTAARPLENLSILVVEDEYLIASDIADAIDAAGGSPMGPCPDVPSARRLLKSSARPHGAVLDLNLKGGSVGALAHELAELGIEIVYHTGYQTTALRERLPRGLMLLKPMRRDCLTQELVRAFGKGGEA